MFKHLLTYFLFTFFFSITYLICTGQDTVRIFSDTYDYISGHELQYYIDTSSSKNINEIQQLNSKFKYYNNHEVPNFGLVTGNVWSRFILKNCTNEFHIFIRISYPLLAKVDLYLADPTHKSWELFSSGEYLLNSKNNLLQKEICFQIPIPKDSSRLFYLEAKAYQQMLLPIYVGTFDRTWQAILKEKFAFFIYLGIILSIFFYNFFVFISTRDINYLYYVIYVFFVGFAQVSLLGYSSRYIWPQSKFLIREGVNISGILSGIAVLLFVMNFLHTKRNSRVLHILVNVYIVAYCLAFIPTFLDYSTFSYKYIDILASSGVTLIWIIGLVLVFKSVKEAKFFLIAWTVFILSVILFVLKDFGFLPYNFFTKNVMLLGSAIETILISLALADKINTYKAEREQARMMALSKSEEVRIVLSQQNITLERMVKKRTEDLERANLELTQTLKNLQEAQIQLIQAEKMATLGQLTAGIAHEINNPINFVKSNVKPLQMDLYDLIALIQTYEKQLQLVLSAHALEEIEAFKKKINYPELVEEIRLLLKGIEEGAERTAEIIRGLRIFSRLDESELKKADIHECIDSTLILLRASIPDNVVIEKHYAQLPLIECYPGKLNQMLMNLLTNAIHAVKSKPQHFPQQAGEPSTEEKIIITTSIEPDGKHIRISVADTGTGMTPEVKQKIFEPFFTTKEVGEGTGLGLPIVYSIVEKHGGKIFVETTYGIGSEFIIILPTTPKTVMQTQEVKEQNS